MTEDSEPSSVQYKGAGGDGGDEGEDIGGDNGKHTSVSESLH